MTPYQQLWYRAMVSKVELTYDTKEDALRARAALYNAVRKARKTGYPEHIAKAAHEVKLLFRPYAPFTITLAHYSTVDSMGKIAEVLRNPGNVTNAEGVDEIAAMAQRALEKVSNPYYGKGE